MTKKIRQAQVSFFVLLFLIQFAGCLHSPAATVEPPSFTDDYLDIWYYYHSRCVLFDYKSIDWVTMGTEYYNKVLECSTEEEFYTVITEMLATLEDPTITFSLESGETFHTWENEYTANVDSQVLVDNYLNNYGFTACTLGYGFCDPEQLPYYQINLLVAEYPASWLQITDSLVSEWNRLNLPAVIIDLRLQAGRSGSISEEVAGRFTESIHPGSISRKRNGPDYNSYFNSVNAIHPRGPEQYLGTVILLAGEQNYGGFETMCADMINNERVVLVGDTTMGSVSTCSGGVTTNVIWIKIPNETILTREWEWIEGVGLPPDQFVQSSPEDFAAGKDPVLEYAINLLGQY